MTYRPGQSQDRSPGLDRLSRQGCRESSKLRGAFRRRFAARWRPAPGRFLTRGGLLLGWLVWVGLGAGVGPGVAWSQTSDQADGSVPGAARHSAAPSRAGDPEVVAAALKAEAIQAAEGIAKAFPEDALSAALLGSAYYNTGQSTKATRHLERCLQLNPAQADAYEILARMAYERGDPELSVQRCRDALKHGARNPEILNQLGRALLDLGQAPEAQQVLRDATQLPRPVAESDYLLGQAFLQSGESSRAKTHFEAALARVPDHTQAMFGLLTAAQQLGDEAGASRYREQFKRLEARDRQTLQARNADPSELSGTPVVRKSAARTLFGAAQIYQAHGDSKSAGPLLYRAAQLDADPPAYRAALESHFVRLQAWQEGVEAFGRLAAEQPGNPFNLLFRGRLLARQGRVDEAGQAFEQVQKLAPDWAEGYRAQAELLLRAGGRATEALKRAGKAVSLAPTAPHYHLLAAVCAQAGDRKGALEAIRQAVTLDPGQAKYRAFEKELERTP